MSTCHAPHRPDLEELMAESELPVLPPDTPYLLKAMASEEMSFRELAAVVERFPSIAAKLIALANSPWSSPVTEVTSVEMACARLGFFVVRSVSVALSLANVFNPAVCPAFDGVRYWTDAFITADLCTTLSEQVTGAAELEPQAVRTAGLLHNLGLLWLATWRPEETHTALSKAAEEPTTPVDRLLERHCGIGFVEAGALLADAWRFPPLLVVSVGCHASPDYQEIHWRSAAVVGLARHFVHRHRDPETPPDPRLDRLGLDTETQQSILERMDRRLDEVRELAGTLFHL